MSNSITVQQILDRIKTHGVGGSLHAGSGASGAVGIAVTYTPTLEVLRKAAGSGINIVVCREGPYWSHNPQALAANPTFAYKRDLIEKHQLVVVQLREAGGGTLGDRYLRGLAEALDWDRYHRIDRPAAGEPYGPDNVYFRLPETTLEALAKSICGRLKIRAARVIGEAGTKVRDVALTHGRMMVPELRKVLREPAVDAVIIGEPVEWEASPYFQDLIASGREKGLIAIGLEASEEPGGRLTTAWLKSFVPEVPVEWIPAGEPFTVLHEVNPMTTPKLSRRKFFRLVGGVCMGGGVVLAQKAPLTVNQVVERIKQRLGGKWGPNTVDTLKAGMDEFAAWLRPVVPEVPVKFIPAGDAFWILKIDG